MRVYKLQFHRTKILGCRIYSKAPGQGAHKTDASPNKLAPPTPAFPSPDRGRAGSLPDGKGGLASRCGRGFLGKALQGWLPSLTPTQLSPAKSPVRPSGGRARAERRLARPEGTARAPEQLRVREPLRRPAGESRSRRRRPLTCHAPLRRSSGSSGGPSSYSRRGRPFEARILLAAAASEGSARGAAARGPRTPLGAWKGAGRQSTEPRTEPRGREGGCPATPSKPLA